MTLRGTVLRNLACNAWRLDVSTTGQSSELTLKAVIESTCSVQKDTVNAKFTAGHWASERKQSTIIEWAVSFFLILLANLFSLAACVYIVSEPNCLYWLTNDEAHHW